MSIPPQRTLKLRRFAERTVPAMLRASARRVPGRTFIRFLDPANPDGPPRPYTFAEFEGATRRAAAWLRGRGVGPGDRVLLLAENSPEWQILAIATQLLRAETAALFSNLDPGPATAIARRVKPRVVCVSNNAQWAKLAGSATELAALGLNAVLCREPLDLETVPGG